MSVRERGDGGSGDFPDFTAAGQVAAIRSIFDFTAESLGELRLWFEMNPPRISINTLAGLHILTALKTWDPANIADGAQTNTTVTVPGATLGDIAVASFSVAGGVPAGAILSAAVTAADVVTVTLFNKTGGALDLASGTLKVLLLRV